MKNLFIATLLSATILAGGTAFAVENKTYTMPKHMEESISKLPQDKQDLVKKSMEEGRESSKASHEKIQALQEELHGILVADSFDKKTFLEKNKAIQTLKTEMGASRAERMADLAEKLTQEERKNFFSSMQHPPHGMKHDCMEKNMKPSMESEPEQE